MISSKVTYYCNGDITRIENYHIAQLDTGHVWWIFHKNLISGVGRLTKDTLKGLGKFYGVPPEELIFVRKEDLRMIEEHFPLTKKKGHSPSIVFKFWTKLNPNTPFSLITEKEFDAINRSVRRLRIIWNQMKARCYNPNAQDFPHYGAKGVRMCQKWYNDSDAFVLWSLKSGYRYFPKRKKGNQLSIDRIDSSRNYCPSNCRWIPHRENCARTRRGDRSYIIDRAYRFARMFPTAAFFGYGWPKIDWRKVRDEYMDGDTSRLVEFLYENGYCPMAVWRIRKGLGDVIPQKKSERTKENGHA